MYTFEGKCPHCRSDRGFIAFGVSKMEMMDYEKSNEHPAILEKWRNIYRDNPLAWYSLGGNCLSCHMPVVARVLAGMKERKRIAECLGNEALESSVHIERVEIFPKPQEFYSHSGIPEHINISFLDVQKMFDAGISAPAIITHCRTTLEAAVNHLGNMNGKESLAKKICNLCEKGIITPQLKEWADIIKNFGNEATHFNHGTLEDAMEMKEFTKIFLQYAYEFPARIEEKKEEIKRMRENRKPGDSVIE